MMMMTKRRQEQQQEAASDEASYLASPLPPLPGRRSSATRELYLTKYYFYQHQTSLKTSDYDSVLDNNDEDDDDHDADHGDCDGDAFDRCDLENYHLLKQQQQQAKLACCVSQLSEPRYADNEPAPAPLQLELHGQVSGRQVASLSLQQAPLVQQPNSPPIVAVPSATNRNQKRAAPTTAIRGNVFNDTNNKSPSQSDNSSLVSQSTTTVSPSSLKSQLQRQPGLPSSSSQDERCSIHHQISLASSGVAATLSGICASSKSSERQQPNIINHHFNNGYRSLQVRLDLQRRNSIPDCESTSANHHHHYHHYHLQQQQQQQQEKRPSIEEQLKRLLEIDTVSPSNNNREDLNQLGKIKDRKPLKSAPSNYSLLSEMKKNSPIGGGGNSKDQAYSNNNNNTHQQGRPGISPDDRLMIFMLASRSTNTNSTVERNARILKWLNNCRSAT